MRGPYQETRRIPHSLKELPQNPQGLKWQITLTPHQGQDVVCPAGKSLLEAFEKAGEVLRTQFPGSTL